jgi:hypothetical protein
MKNLKPFISADSLETRFLTMCLKTKQRKDIELTGTSITMQSGFLLRKKNRYTPARIRAWNTQRTGMKRTTHTHGHETHNTHTHGTPNTHTQAWNTQHTQAWNTHHTGMEHPPHTGEKRHLCPTLHKLHNRWRVY